MDSNSEIQGYNVYPMLHFHRKFSSGVTVLERIARIRSKTPADDIISWPESRGEQTETVERIDKGKSREIVEEECDNK